MPIFFAVRVIQLGLLGPWTQKMLAASHAKRVFLGYLVILVLRVRARRELVLPGVLVVATVVLLIAASNG
jgi:hypothetical protein